MIQPRRGRCGTAPLSEDAQFGEKPAQGDNQPALPDRNGSGPQNITALLHEWQAGDRRALDRLIPLVYEELRTMASRHLSRERHGLLQTTALVHEAYARLVD